MPTIGLLLGLMVVSAQFRLGGFTPVLPSGYPRLRVTPERCWLVIAAAAALSALLSNDIICLAMAAILADGCARPGGGSTPVPFLLALAACGKRRLGGHLDRQSAKHAHRPGATDRLQPLSGPSDRADARRPVSALPVWLVIWQRYGGCWERQTAMPDRAVQPFDAWQTAKGLGVLAAAPSPFPDGRTWPRDVLALAAAGVLLMNRKMATRAMLELVDWQLLILFASLFIVNHSMQQSGNLSRIIGHAKSAGFDPSQPAELFGAASRLSNLVSNVPATMLLLPSAVHPVGRTDPRPFQHACGQSADRRQHRKHYRRRPGVAVGPVDHVARPRARRGPGHAPDACSRRRLAGFARLKVAHKPPRSKPRPSAKPRVVSFRGGRRTARAAVRNHFAADAAGVWLAALASWYTPWKTRFAYGFAGSSPHDWTSV